MSVKREGSLRIAVFPGAGIGVEVTEEAVKVPDLLNRLLCFDLEFVYFAYEWPLKRRRSAAVPPCGSR
jgi:isocitrate/isopropylmalate dehydrogenase